MQVAQHAKQWFWFFEARENAETAPFTLWYVICGLFEKVCPTYHTQVERWSRVFVHGRPFPR